MDNSYFGAKRSQKPRKLRNDGKVRYSYIFVKLKSGVKIWSELDMNLDYWEIYVLDIFKNVVEIEIDTWINE